MDFGEVGEKTTGLPAAGWLNNESLPESELIVAELAGAELTKKFLGENSTKIDPS